MVFSALRFNPFAKQICSDSRQLPARPCCCSSALGIAPAVLNRAVPPLCSSDPPQYSSIPMHSPSMPLLRSYTQFCASAWLYFSLAHRRCSLPLRIRSMPFLCHSTSRRAIAYHFHAFAEPLNAIPLLFAADLRNFKAMPSLPSAFPLLRYAFAPLFNALAFLYSSYASICAVPKLCVSGHFRSFGQQRPSTSPRSLCCFKRRGGSHSSWDWNSSFHWQCLKAMWAA